MLDSSLGQKFQGNPPYVLHLLYWNTSTIWKNNYLSYLYAKSNYAATADSISVEIIVFTMIPS